MASDHNVLSEFDAASGIARITLNRPDALNAVNQAMADAFLAAVKPAVGREGLRCLLIRGAGRAFAAGGDVTAFADPATAASAIDGILGPMHEAVKLLQVCPAPVVTAVQGVAAGAGFSLALCGDLVFAEEGAKFAVAYTKLGGTPDCGLTWTLARRIGPARTLEMLLEAATVDAAAAKAMGIVTDVFAAGGFDAAVEERVRRLAQGPTQAYAACRVLLANECSLSEQLEKERKAFVAAAGTTDFAEGVSAFLGRRAPAFEGR
jgi:2-(1,2-epoxy-1,2-dihydrophenyl)acetyl-CoA isomerase